MKNPLRPATFVALLATMSLLVAAVPVTSTSSSSSSTKISSSSSTSSSKASSSVVSSTKAASSSIASSTKVSSSSIASSTKISSSSVASSTKASVVSSTKGASSSLVATTKAPLSSSIIASSTTKSNLIATYTGSDATSSDEASNSNQTSCKAYISPAMGLASASECYSYCQYDPKSTSNNNSVACVASGVELPVYKDAQGNQYNPGICECNLAILNVVTNILIQAAEAVGEIGCELMFACLDSVLEVAGMLIPGVDDLEAADAATQIAVKAANAVADKGGDALDFLNWFGGPCPSSNYSSVANDIYLPLIGKGRPGRDPKPKDPKVSAPKESAPKESAPKTSAPKETSAKTSAPKATTDKTTAPKATSVKTTAPKATSDKTSAPKATSDKTTAPKETSDKTTVPKATSDKTTAPKETSDKTTVPKETSDKTTVPKETADKTSAPKETSAKTTDHTSAAKTTHPKSTDVKSTDSKSTDAKSTGASNNNPQSTVGPTSKETAKSTDGKSTSEPTTTHTSHSSSATSHSSSTSRTSSSSSSSSGCRASSTSKAQRRSALEPRDIDDDYVEPDCDTVDQIIKYLKTYDMNTADQNRLINNIIIPKLMKVTSPKADSSMFYATDPTSDPLSAAKGASDTHGKYFDQNNVGTVFWDYEKGPFNPAKEPRKSITANGLDTTWFRATSRAYARVSSGKAVFIYDGDYKTAKGRDGKPSIFITDELPELKKNPKITEVVQMKSAMASVWNPDSELAFAFMSENDLGVSLVDNKIPTVKIWPSS